MRAVVACLLMLIAAACSAPPATDPPTPETPFLGIDGKPLIMADGTIDNSVQQALTANPAACAKAGGEIRKVCMLGTPMCVVAFSDAGKSCSDSSECMGNCTLPMSAPPGQPATGQCTANNDPCGCFQLVEKGVAGYPLCAD